jgi:hypothetical protein
MVAFNGVLKLGERRRKLPLTGGVVNTVGVQKFETISYSPPIAHRLLPTTNTPYFQRAIRYILGNYRYDPSQGIGDLEGRRGSIQNIRLLWLKFGCIVSVYLAEKSWQ